MGISSGMTSRPRLRLTLAIALLLVAPVARAQDTLYLTHFDVGQGDATLITTYQGKRILIDAGPSGGEVARRLRAVGIDTIDLVVASHNHEDHIGGMPAVFAAFVVRAYLDNGLPANTQIFSRTQFAVLREAGLMYLEPTSRTVRVGDVALRVLPPARIDTEQNNNSVGILLEYGRFSALYTGDSETGQLSHWIARKQLKNVHLLKAAHHGSSNGASKELAAATKPVLVIVSAGRGNSYGHPGPDVLQLWSSARARIYRTDVDGTVQVNAMRDGSFKVLSYPRAAAKPAIRR
jgi:competence protein ComEC